MPKNTKYTLLLFIFIICLKSVSAQPTKGLLMGLGNSAGITNYSGELANSINIKFVRPGFGAHFIVNYNDHIAVRAELFQGWVTASDAGATNPLRKARNLNFRSSITEFSIQGMYRFGKRTYGHVYRRNKITPYLFGGIGIFRFNPEAQVDGHWVEVHDLGTEGQYLDSGDNPKPYSLYQVVIPFGLGVSYKLNTFIDVGIELGLRKTFTDYLDDVSGKYPDLQKLDAKNPEAYFFSDRTDKAKDPGIYTNSGKPRGNSDYNDWYYYTNLTVTYYFFHTPKRHVDLNKRCTSL